jgi:hypothetical protein
MNAKQTTLPKWLSEQGELGDFRIEFPLVFPAAKVVLNGVRVGAARFRRRVTS